MKMRFINSLVSTIFIISLLCCSTKEDPTPENEEEQEEEVPGTTNSPVSYDRSYMLALENASFVAMQQDGKVVVVGKSNSTTAPVFRLDKDGKYDPSFNIDQDKSWIINSIQGLGIQPSGKVILSGKFVIANKTYDLIRLTDTGLLDKSFPFHPYVANSSFSDVSLTIKLVQPDGKIICTTSALYTSQSMRYSGTYRINVDGTSDSGFKSEFYTNSYPSFVALPDNKLLVYGVTIVEGANRRRNIARLNADGSLDLSFNFKEQLVQENGLSGIYSVAAQSDGKIVFSGKFNQLVDDSQRDTKFPLLNFCRLEKDGAIDLSFYVNTREIIASRILVRPDNSYITLLSKGSTNPAQMAIFGKDGIFKGSLKLADESSSFSTILKQSENQYLLTGNIINNGQKYNIARLTIK